MDTSDGEHFSLFLNHPDEYQKIEKIGVHLQDYDWPLSNDDLEKALAKKIIGNPLKLHYIKRNEHCNIASIEFISDESEI